MSASEREHARLQSRRESYALGIANPELATEIKSHLVGCAECREFVEDLGLTPLPGETAGAHLPESMLVQWARVGPTLRGLERELVRRHLGRCALCRDNLRMLGHEPDLKQVPALEPSATVLKSLEPQPRLNQEAKPRMMTRLFGAWPVTTWAAAATAMLVVAYVNPALLSRSSLSGGGGSAPTPGSDPGGHRALTTGSPTFLLTTPGAGVALSGSVRGVKQVALRTIEIGASQQSLRVFGGPNSSLSSDAVVNITLQGPHGEDLGKVTMIHELLWSKDGGVEINSSAPLEPGPYVMQVAAAAPTSANPDTLVYRFELKRVMH